MADPFSLPDPFAMADPFAFHGAGHRRQAAYPPLGEAETDQAIQGLTGHALSGIGYVGSELDKLFGGRAVRAGVNAGINAVQGHGSLWDLRDVLSVFPGTDLAHITNPNETVSGNEILAKTLGDPATSDNWAYKHLAGPAVEVALDPSMYLGGIGALTVAGKSAKLAGTATKGFLPAIAAGERTLIHGLTGPGVADIAGGLAKTAGKAASGLNVGVRKLPLVGGLAGNAIDAGAAGAKQARLVGRSLFDPKAGRVANEAMQAANEFTRVPAEHGAMVAAAKDEFDLRRMLAPLWKSGVDPELVSRQLTRMGQDVPPLASPSMSNVLPAALHEAARHIRGQLDPLPAASRELGVPSAVWNGDYDLDYMLGRINKTKGMGTGASAKVSQPFSPRNSSQIRKKEIFDLPEGMDQLEHQFIRNPLMSGKGRAGAQDAAAIRAAGEDAVRGLAPNSSEYATEMARSAAEEMMAAGPETSAKDAIKFVRKAIMAEHMKVPDLATEGTFPIDFKKVAQKKSSVLARYLGKVKGEHIGPNAEPFFSPDIPGNVFERRRRSATSDAKAMGVHDVIHRVGVPGEVEGGMPVMDLITKAGLTGEGGLMSALRALKQDPLEILAAASAEAEGPVDSLKVLHDALKGFSVPGSEAKAVTKYMNPWAAPEEWAPVLGGLDWLNAKFRDFTYSGWPASWGRNFGSGGWENALEGTLPIGRTVQRATPEIVTTAASSADVMRQMLERAKNHGGRRWVYEYTDPMGNVTRGAAGPESVGVGLRSPYADIAALRRGEGIDTGIEGFDVLTPSEQSIALQREMYGQGIGGRFQGQAGSASTGRPGIMFDPAAARESIPSMLKGYRPGNMIQTGKKVNEAVEENLRMPQYLDLRRKGLSEEAAAAEVYKNHFDYRRQASTDFENAVMKRLIPFYMFPSRNIPKQIGRAIQAPGKVTTPIRLAGQMQDSEGYVPEYLQNGLALPLGSEQAAQQTYLSQLGLPMEEAFSRLKIGTGAVDTLTKTGQGLLGLLRPELKGVLENLSGKQFFTGRDLADLHVGSVESGFGNLDEETSRLVAQALLNSPATRMVSTANRLLDERKHTPAGLAGLGLGLTTGAKITDVETEKWRAIDARHNLEELMHGSPGIRQSVDYYPTREAKLGGTLTPEQELNLRKYASLKLRAREAAKEKLRVGVQTGGF